MTKQPRKTRYSSSNYIHDIFGFIRNHVLSCSKPGQKYIVEEYFDHQSIDESQEVIPITVEYVHAHTPVHIPDAPVETPERHKPPALSPTPAESPDVSLLLCLLLLLNLWMFISLLLYLLLL
jgi:hypothetical protein